MTEKQEKQEKQEEKVLFSWRVIQEPDGSIRTEGHVHPDWKEEAEGFGPGFHHRHGRHGRRGGFGPMGMGRGFMAGGWRTRRRERARELRDWLEQMYDEFSNREADEDAEPAEDM